MGAALRILATVAILLLLALDVWLPRTSLGRRGTETTVRADAVSAVAVGERFPDLPLETWDGETVRLSDLRGHPVLLIFERSVDW